MSAGDFLSGWPTYQSPGFWGYARTQNACREFNAQAEVDALKARVEELERRLAKVEATQ